MVEALLLGLLLATMCGSVYAYPVPAAVRSDSGSSPAVSISVSAWSPWAPAHPAAPPAPPFSYSYSVDGDSNGDNNGDSDTVLHNSANASIINNGSSIPMSASASSFSLTRHRQGDEMPVRNERSTNLSAQIFGSTRKIHIFIMNRLLQLSPDGVVNGTFDDTKYTILQRITTGRGQLLIQGVETCQYLCMDSCGFLYGSRKASSECVFNEMLGADNFNTYSSTKYSNINRTLYMALNRNGQPRKILVRANHSLGGLAIFTRVLTRPVAHERLLHLHLRHSHHNHRCNGPGQLPASVLSSAGPLDTIQRLQPTADDATALGNGAGAGNGLASSHSPANHLQCRRRRWRRKKKRRKQPHHSTQSNTRLINSSNINNSNNANVKCSNSNSADDNNDECQRKDGSRGQVNRKLRRGGNVAKKGTQRKKMLGNGPRRSGPVAETATNTVPGTDGSAASVPVASPAEDGEEDASDSSTQVEWEEHDTTSHPDMVPDNYNSADLQTDLLEDSSAIMTHPD